MEYIQLIIFSVLFPMADNFKVTLNLQTHFKLHSIFHIMIVSNVFGVRQPSDQVKALFKAEHFEGLVFELLQLRIEPGILFVSLHK